MQFTIESVLCSGDIHTLIRLQQQTLEKVKRLDSKIADLQSVLATSLQELKKLLEEKAQRSFSIKDSGYEVSKILSRLHECLFFSLIYVTKWQRFFVIP